MKKCLKIAFGHTGSDTLIRDIQKKGSKLGVEGTIQIVTGEKELRIVVCGLKEQVDKFVDELHKEAAHAGVADISIEPFVRIKDYRGAFRIIE
jgi:acylphosphatase